MRPVILMSRNLRERSSGPRDPKCVWLPFWEQRYENEDLICFHLPLEHKVATQISGSRRARWKHILPYPLIKPDTKCGKGSHAKRSSPGGVTTWLWRYDSTTSRVSYSPSPLVTTPNFIAFTLPLPSFKRCRN